MSEVEIMRRIVDLYELPAFDRLAVIINCGTKWVSTLALASLRKASDMPILLIDCESKDGSAEHFSQLAREHGLSFFWLEWPLRKHGLSLDRLFREVRAEQILLVDSDVEIRDPSVLHSVCAALENDAQAYGAGFVHGPEWLGEAHGLPARVGWYAERMWIPFVLLRTALIRSAIAQKFSFAQQRRFLEVRDYPALSRWLTLRFWIPGLRQIGARGRAEKVDRPAFIESDTGADMHEALLGSGYRFTALPVEDWPKAHHYHGVTRSGLAWKRRKLAQRMGLVASANDTSQNLILDEVRRRLDEHYSIGSQTADSTATTEYD